MVFSYFHQGSHVDDYEFIERAPASHRRKLSKRRKQKTVSYPSPQQNPYYDPSAYNQPPFHSYDNEPRYDYWEDNGYDQQDDYFDQGYDQVYDYSRRVSPQLHPGYYYPSPLTSEARYPMTHPSASPTMTSPMSPAFGSTTRLFRHRSTNSTLPRRMSKRQDRPYYPTSFDQAYYNDLDDEAILLEQRASTTYGRRRSAVDDTDVYYGEPMAQAPAHLLHRRSSAHFTSPDLPSVSTTRMPPPSHPNSSISILPPSIQDNEPPPPTSTPFSQPFFGPQQPMMPPPLPQPMMSPASSFLPPQPFPPFGYNVPAHPMQPMNPMMMFNPSMMATAEQLPPASAATSDRPSPPISQPPSDPTNKEPTQADTNENNDLSHGLPEGAFSSPLGASASSDMSGPPELLTSGGSLPTTRRPSANSLAPLARSLSLADFRGEKKTSGLVRRLSTLGNFFGGDKKSDRQSVMHVDVDALTHDSLTQKQRIALEKKTRALAKQDFIWCHRRIPNASEPNLPISPWVAFSPKNQQKLMKYIHFYQPSAVVQGLYHAEKLPNLVQLDKEPQVTGSITAYPSFKIARVYRSMFSSVNCYDMVIGCLPASSHFVVRTDVV
ncbi:hypothetical protein DM01DRAFT_1337565 [Hesseltinella vesiculosa]|uniref:Uncharacterized protein n=1 Tax=Hesseltinella vesiculosa TaxID=101127 RepID=A0A1X2GD50_9FUNG|nr:hypothetical protein DM01DRAFT_1337565 [Hesseltinella vesiculosa]